jgi:hypothetical protein
LREQDLSIEDIELLKNGLKHYYITLEKSYEETLEAGMEDISSVLKNKLEEVRQLRRKLDGRD